MMPFFWLLAWLNAHPECVNGALANVRMLHETNPPLTVRCSNPECDNFNVEIDFVEVGRDTNSRIADARCFWCYGPVRLMGREWKCEDCGTEFTATATQLADEHGECPECGSCAIYAQP